MPDGNLQAISFHQSDPMGYIKWEKDPATERQLLIDYLDRIHKFRIGKYEYQVMAPFGAATHTAEPPMIAWLLT